MEKQAIIVLDNDQYKYTPDCLNDIPFVAQNFEVFGFADDGSALEFIHKNHERVVGLIQDSNRSGASFRNLQQYRQHLRDDFCLRGDGANFYYYVVDLLAPWINVMFNSAYFGDEEEIVLSEWSNIDPRISFLSKPAQPEQFADHLARWVRDPFSNRSAETRILEPLTEELALAFSKDESLMHEVSPRQFEEFIEIVFRNHGFRTELTAKTRDGGYDIRAVQANGRNDLMLIEVKRYALRNRVGVGVLRALYGLKHLHRAQKVALVTSSFLSRDARKEFSRTIPHEIEIWEYDRLMQFCLKYADDLITADVREQG